MIPECAWCNLPLPDDLAEVENDHIIPKLWGGPDDPWNRQLLHRRCNQAKGGKLTTLALALAEEHGVTLIRRAPLQVAPEDYPPWVVEILDAIWQMPPVCARDPYALKDMLDLQVTFRDAANRAIYIAWKNKRASLNQLTTLLGMSRAAVWKRIQMGKAATP